MKATPIRVMFRLLFFMAFFMLMYTVWRCDIDALPLGQIVWRMLMWSGLAVVGAVFSGALEWER